VRRKGSIVAKST